MKFYGNFILRLMFWMLYTCRNNVKLKQMKQLFTIAMILLTMGLSAQTTTLEKLKNKKWVDRRYENKYKYGITAYYFTANSHTMFNAGKDGTPSCKPDFNKFYLSDTEDFIFKDEKVGKATEGKYLVCKMFDKVNYGKNACVLKILKITEDELHVVTAKTGHRHIFKSEGYISDREIENKSKL